MSSSSSAIATLNGPAEPSADTIRKMLYDAWAASGNTESIMFVSEGGVNDSTDPLTTNDLKMLEADGRAYVRVYDGDHNGISSSNWLSYYEEMVYVDIYGRWSPTYVESDLRKLLLKIMHVIDDIILRKRRGPYLKASDGLNSGIISIHNRTIDWVRVAEDESVQKTVSYHGVILARRQRSITTSS